jgi:chemotaxis protein methyltransferase CheR
MNNTNTAFSTLIVQHAPDSSVMSGDVFEKWRKYIYDNCGIYFQDNKKYLLESRLLKRLNYLDLKSFEDYLNFLLYDPAGRAEQTYLFEAITINETFFFRNQPQLDALIGKVLPDIINEKMKHGKGRIKIWSAASSSGEEAYSVALTIDNLFASKYPAVDYEILGTDISDAVIRTAKNGIYKTYSMRNTAAYYIKKYFKINGSNYELDQKIKNKVNFRLLNLYDDNAMKSMFNYDIIFCANVLIYFDQKSKIKVVNRLYNSLNKGGYLFIGYSETLHNISQAFQIVSFPKTIGYKKV